MIPEQPETAYPGKAVRIGIDGRNLRGNRRGDGRYVFELCRCLDSLLPDARFFVYSAVPVELPVISARWRMRPDHPCLGRLPPLVWLKSRVPYLSRRDRLDVFWGTNTFLPPLPKTMKKVITVHDFCFQIMPETFPIAHLLTNRLFFIRDVRRADLVLANSRGTSKRLLPIIGYRPTVVYPAVEESFRPQKPAVIESCRKIYGLSTPYLMNAAVWEPRKNIELLVRTFMKMKKSGVLKEHKLVLVGKKGWKHKRILPLVKESGGQIVSLGYVPDRHLPALYAGADVFVFPSVYEGFGIPVLEARACGTTVVTTDIPELREAGGENAVYIQPTEEGLRQGIITALQKPPALPKRQDLPTWKQSAARLASALCGTNRGAS